MTPPTAQPGKISDALADARRHPPEGSRAAEYVEFASRRFVLATDLDGTFLGGSDADRRKLYEWIEANQAEVGLIFVTGRDPQFLEQLCADTFVPWPEYVIGDVGTTIARVEFDEAGKGRVTPMAPLETWIADAWGDAGDKVRAALDGHPGLSLQPTAFRHRVSYDYDPAAFDPSAHQIVADLGLDSLVSDNRFFDVLPRGVSKGPSLLRLLAHLGVAEHKTLAAGDTLNDYSMLALDLPGVAVGGAESGLLEKLPDRANLHKAAAIGAGGILEAVARLGLHPSPPAPDADADPSVA